MIFDNASPCQKILENNSAYIASLYDSCFNSVKKMVMNNSGTEDEAYDIFQEAFVVLFQKCNEKDFVLSCHPCTYLGSVSRNKWLKELERRKKEKKKILKLTDENIDDKVSAHMERERLVAKYFLLLTERCQKILQLGCIEDLPGRDVAEKTGHTYGGYRVAKYECLQNLFNHLEGDDQWNELKS